MAGLAILRNGTWHELPAGRPVTVGERQASYRALLENAELRQRYDVKTIVEEDYPGPGFTVTGSHLEDRNGVPTRVWDVIAAPVQAQPAPGGGTVPEQLEMLLVALVAENVINAAKADALRARLKI